MKYLKIIFSIFIFSLIISCQNFADKNSEDRFEKLINVVELGRAKSTTKKMSLLNERLKMDREKKLSSVWDKLFQGMPDYYLNVALDVSREKSNDLTSKLIPTTKTKINEVKSKNIPFLEKQVQSSMIERRYKKQKKTNLKNMKASLSALSLELKFLEGMTKYYASLISYLETKLGEKEKFFR